MSAKPTEHRLHHAHSMCCRRSEEHTSELQSQSNLVCRLLLEKKHFSYFIGLIVPNWLFSFTPFLMKFCPAGPVSLILLLSYIFFFFFKETGAPGALPFSPTRPFPN